jgi:hypothetical protein
MRLLHVFLLMKAIPIGLELHTVSLNTNLTYNTNITYNDNIAYNSNTVQDN